MKKKQTLILSIVVGFIGVLAFYSIYENQGNKARTPAYAGDYDVTANLMDVPYHAVLKSTRDTIEKHVSSWVKAGNNDPDFSPTKAQRKQLFDDLNALGLYPDPGAILSYEPFANDYGIRFYNRDNDLLPKLQIYADMRFKKNKFQFAEQSISYLFDRHIRVSGVWLYTGYNTGSGQHGWVYSFDEKAKQKIAELEKNKSSEKERFLLKMFVKAVDPALIKVLKAHLIAMGPENVIKVIRKRKRLIYDDLIQHRVLLIDEFVNTLYHAQRYPNISAVCRDQFCTYRFNLGWGVVYYKFYWHEADNSLSFRHMSFEGRMTQLLYDHNGMYLSGE